MSIRDEPVVREARLADGRALSVRVVVPDDPYVGRERLETVVLELRDGDASVGVVPTTLGPGDGEEALLLAERVRLGLESGSLEPTAEGIAAVASTPPA